METYRYPASFPNNDEEMFLRLVLCDDAQFVMLWKDWSEHVVFDDLDHATVRMLPALSLRLDKHGIEGELVKRIHGVYKYAWLKNEQLLNVVYSVAKMCADNNIEVAFLKGVPLLLSVYKNTAMRILSDADMLVHSDDVLRLFTLLQSEGWVHRDPSMVSVTQFGLDKVIHATVMIHPSGAKLEIHWNVYHVDTFEYTLQLLMFNKDIPMQKRDFWKHALPLSVRDIPCNMLSYEDLFVHVIVHGAEGSVRRPVRWVVDAVSVMRTIDLDWERVYEIVTELGYEYHMQVALRYLREVYDVVFPDDFIKKLYSKKSSDKVIKRYYQVGEIHFPLLGNFPLLWYRYWLYESEGSVVHKMLQFPAYLKIAWKIPKQKSVFAFMFDKYAKRISRSL